MPTAFTVPFEITAWDAEPYDTPEDGPKLTRVTVRKTFNGGLEGTSVAQLLTCEGDGGQGFVASERVTGTLDGRSGTFVMQHGGLAGGPGEPTSFGSIIPGSGTGDLVGLAGVVSFAHDEAGARVTLTIS